MEDIQTDYFTFGHNHILHSLLELKMLIISRVKYVQPDENAQKLDS